MARRKKQDERKIGLEDYKRFVASPLWKDLQEIIRGRLVHCQTLLNNENDSTKLYRLQGHLKELEILLCLPDAIISDLEYDQAKLTTTLEVNNAEGREGTRPEADGQ